MLVSEVMTLLGQHGFLQVDQLTIEVRITDVRERFGTTDVLVEPHAGVGQQWVELRRITLAD